MSDNSRNFANTKNILEDIMATYTITLNERSNSGKALLGYLQSLGVLVQKVTKRTTSYERSKKDVKAGRIEKFASSEEMFQSLGI